MSGKPKKGMKMVVTCIGEDISNSAQKNLSAPTKKIGKDGNKNVD